MQPYVYDGRWSTACRLKKEKMTYLRFMVNSKLANVSMTLETIHPLDPEENPSQAMENVFQKTETASTDRSTPSSKMLLGNYTLIYVITGAIRAQIFDGLCAKELHQGQTLICERTDTSLPADISMSPLDSSFTNSNVLLIQVNVIQPTQDFTSPDLRPMSVTRPLRNRTSSIIIFDDKSPMSHFDSQMSFMDLTTPLMEEPLQS